MARLLLVGLVAAPLAMVAGCTSGNSSAATEASNLKPLAVMYGQYVREHRGQKPPNENAFKEFVQAQPADRLQALGVENSDSLFVSQRDNQPFTILYGDATIAGPDGMQIIAYESQGRDGVRWIAGDLGNVQEITDAEFAELVPSS